MHPFNVGLGLLCQSSDCREGEDLGCNVVLYRPQAGSGFGSLEIAAEFGNAAARGGKSCHGFLESC